MANGTFGKFSISIMIIGVAVIALLLIPLPVILLDILMVINLIISLLMLLMAFNMKRAAEFSILPRMLLLITIFQLSLNVSSTRLILIRGTDFDGRLIRAIANSVTGSGGIMVLTAGFVIYIVITTIQIMIFAKSATLFTETTRFTLDTLQEKQMAKYAEKSSGAITEEKSLAWKIALQLECEFISSMDGAGKFIFGNMKAGIFITLVNILGGIIIGTTLHGEPVMEAVNTYISLAIGAGLLFQFPTLLILISAVIFVFRASGEINGK